MTKKERIAGAGFTPSGFNGFHYSDTELTMPEVLSLQGREAHDDSNRVPTRRPLGFGLRRSDRRALPASSL